MKIELNGADHELGSSVPVMTLMQQLGLAHRKVAVAVNRQVIPMNLWAQHLVQAGDRVEVIQAISGG
ncbi:sulfur carrier protein ThiS [Ampullimonas aquatilis]|uniref:sulfur carrier protein ThiS n=1 Tax=Ampullimonas aquatilis TaxID=1341549 RepID=UPI003C789863